MKFLDTVLSVLVLAITFVVCYGFLTLIVDYGHL